MPSVTNYNITGFTEGEGNVLVRLIQFTSEGTNYFPGLMILIMMYFIIFFTLKLKGTTTVAAFVACNLVNFILALMLYPLQAVGGKILVISIILVPISVLLLWIFQSSSY